uniref:Protein MMS22-like n=1 Tax=Takifugu rubripes TaxID=31033 RepID=A0A674NIX5_TAKRU
MDDDFSQSLTPPVSPFAGGSLCELTSPRPLCFSCSETKDDPSRGFSTEGYIARGSLKRLLLQLDPAPAECETDTIEIFGFVWVTETALVESTKLLFGLFRQKVYRLETLVQSSSTRDFGQVGNLHYEAEDLRQQCVSFLQYVKVFLYRYAVHPFHKLEAQLPSALLEELFGITLLIGRLKDLPASLQSAFTMSNQGKIFPPSWHLLHLHLDIHWSVLEILHLLGNKLQGQVVYAHQFVNLTGEYLTDTSLFEEHLCNLLCDLTGLAMGKYSKVRPTEALSIHHYLCPCTKEFWVLLMHLLEHRHKAMRRQSFWSYMNSLLRPLVSGKPAPEQFRGLPTHCNDLLGFTWWLVTHVSMLSQYNRNGTPQTEKNVGDNWNFVEELLKLTCNPKQGLPEEHIRMHVHCCLSLSLLWEPSTSAVSTLWEYYSRNLNASCSVKWLGVSDLGTLYKTPLALLAQARSCCSPSPLHSLGHTQLYRSASSFHIFLRVLALCLAQDGVAGFPQRQIKGRVYSKFSQKKMQELSETGLMNFLLLFLVVARQVELEDVASRACELLGFLPSNCPTGHRTLIWRGQLSLLALASSFNQTAKEFYSKTTEVSRKLALWGPLSSYMEGVVEVFETSTNLSLSQEKLLNEGFDWLLPACRVSELNSALSFLQVVLAQLRRVHQHSVQSAPNSSLAPSSVSAVKERHLAVAAALWAHFYPFLRSLRLSQTPPALLADAAAGFTLLAFDLPSSAPHDLQPSPVQSIMQSFGWDDMVHPLLVTRYLYLLENRELVSSLSSDSAQSLSVRSWFRCVLQQHHHKNPDGSDSRTGAVISSVYNGLQALSERSSMVTRALNYIGGIMKYIKPSLTSKNQEGLKLVFWAVGRCCIVKHWSPLLATSKAQQLLFSIVDGLLLPRNVTQQDKALRDNLHLYLQGLSVAASLSQSQGAYLKQQLRSVIRRYLDHFLPASPSVGIIANHPVLLSACEVNPTPGGAALRKAILEVLCESFLQFKGHAPPPRLASVLAFLSELLRRNNDSDAALLTLPLPSLLRCMMVNEPQVRKTSTDALQLVVERRAATSTEGPCGHMLSVFHSFVKENEGVYERQVYSVLETVAVLDPALVQALVPNLSLSLRHTEHKRGLGKNIALRSAYKKLLNLLGECGQAEITSLEAD